MNDFNPTNPVCFLSTHPDDVALSCSNYIVNHPGIAVLTVFAGAPSGQDAFQHGNNRKSTKLDLPTEQMAARRAEDKIALESLGAKPYWLYLWESDYLEDGVRDEIELIKELRNKLKELGVASIVAPVGFAHSDHQAVSDACLKLIQQTQLDLYFYLDMPAAQSTDDDKLEKIEPRLREIQKSVELEELRPVPAVGQTKREAMKLYVTANSGLIKEEPGYDEAMVAPERYWKVILN
jgi:LmbE family N-acetylglucosaminyl deacetylase